MPNITKFTACKQTSSTLGVIYVAILLYVCNSSPCLAADKLRFELIESRAHDNRLFTQGLIVDGERLIESSGLYGKSLVRSYEIHSGKTIRQQNLPATFFAEGITRFKDTLYLLTWREGTLFLLDPETLSIRQTLRYKGEGWGITHNGKSLFTSDGSHYIQVRKPSDFSIENTLTVKHATLGKVNQLNELEYANGLIWANRWRSNSIYAIHPHSGEIKAELDLSELVPALYKKSHKHVLNGIAYDPDKNAFWITGKNWPIRHLIKISLPESLYLAQ